MPDDRGRILNPILRLLRGVLGASLLPVAAAVAVLGAAAMLAIVSPLTSSVLAVSLTLLGAILVVGSLFGTLAFQVAGIRRPHGHGHRFGLTLTAVLGLAATMLLFKPLELTAHVAQPRADTRYWQLSTGSHLAYTLFPAVGWRRPEPIVFLHGGPGAPLRESDREFFERFARQGYDVYLYEQVGTGRSEPLQNLRDYTVRRNVDDLEAIRRTLGAERLILIGQSWGAALAARYAAAHPQQVAKLLFLSPGPMSTSGELAIDASRTAAAGADTTPPLRVMAARYLADVNPGLAANFAPPQEMNDYMGSVAPRLMRQSYCAGDAASVPRVDGGGFNFYANQVTQQDLRSQTDPRPELRQSETPTLVMKGECDYVPWAVALDYRASFPNSRGVYLAHTGHLLWGGQPDLTFQVMRAFLEDAPLPAGQREF